jgi:hypothetical protein
MRGVFCGAGNCFYAWAYQEASFSGRISANGFLTEGACSLNYKVVGRLTAVMKYHEAGRD